MAQQPARSRRGPKPTSRPGRRVPQAVIDAIDYRDARTLEPFLTDRGRIKSRRNSGLSRKGQAKLARHVKRARELALLPYVRPTDGRSQDRERPRR